MAVGVTPVADWVTPLTLSLPTIALVVKGVALARLA